MPRPSTARLGRAKRGGAVDRLLARQQVARRHGAERKEDDADRHRAGAVAPAVGDDERADQRPAQAADRVEGMEGRHRRLPPERLDLGGLDVADDVEPAHQQAEEEEGDEEERHGAGEDRQGNRRHVEDHAGRCRDARADMADRPAHDRHGDHRAARHDEEREAEDRRADPEALLDERDVDGPEAGAGAKKKEGDRNRDPRPEGEGVAIGGGRPAGRPCSFLRFSGLTVARRGAMCRRGRGAGQWHVAAEPAGDGAKHRVAGGVRRDRKAKLRSPR